MALRKISSNISKWTKELFIYKGGQKYPIKRVLTHNNVSSSEVYPESPVRIRVTSNFDDSQRMRAETGKP